LDRGEPIGSDSPSFFGGFGHPFLFSHYGTRRLSTLFSSQARFFAPQPQRAVCPASESTARAGHFFSGNIFNYL
jgi:hypothetical protein